MNSTMYIPTRMLAALAVLFAATALADDFSLDWYTIDNGGDLWTIGGDFELSGTAGQPDAGVTMSGGDFELTGGFWAGVPPYAVGDLNCDGSVNFFDIDPFVLAITMPAAYEATYPDCDINLADLNQDGLVNFFDIDPFVLLITGK